MKPSAKRNSCWRNFVDHLEAHYPRNELESLVRIVMETQAIGSSNVKDCRHDVTCLFVATSTFRLANFC